MAEQLGHTMVVAAGATEAMLTKTKQRIGEMKKDGVKRPTAIS